MTSPTSVLRVHQADHAALAALWARYQLRVVALPDGQPLPGSYWGEDEAGLVGDQLFIRPQTPIHSAFHEACHYLCMDAARRQGLHTDAGGDFAEENGVCYLQILLADALPPMSRARMCQDMDAWGYTFRLGSAQAWFERDADDARDWLITHGLLDGHSRPTWRKRS